MYFAYLINELMFNVNGHFASDSACRRMMRFGMKWACSKLNASDPRASQPLILLMKTLNLIVRRTRLSTYGDRAFPVAGPLIWNSLPPSEWFWKWDGWGRRAWATGGGEPRCRRRRRVFPLTNKGVWGKSFRNLCANWFILECESLLKHLGQIQINIAFITTSVHLNLIVHNLFFSQGRLA